MKFSFIPMAFDHMLNIPQKLMCAVFSFVSTNLEKSFEFEQFSCISPVAVSYWCPDSHI